MNKKEIRLHIIALFLISFGGWLLHMRIHPVSERAINSGALIFGLLGTFIVPWLMGCRKTVILGYLLNGFGVVLGTLLMAHFSISKIVWPLSFSGIFLNTTLPDISIMFSKLLIGQEILKYYFPKGLGRLFNFRWWVIHFSGPAIIYILGHHLWR